MAIYTVDDIKKENNKCFSIQLTNNSVYVYCRWDSLKNRLYGKLHGDITNKWRIVPQSKISLIWRHDAIMSSI